MPDLSVSGLKKYNVVAPATENDIFSGVGKRVLKVNLIHGSAASRITLFNAATATGTDIIESSGVANGQSISVDFGAPGGYVMDTAITVVLAGTAAKAEIYYMDL